MSDLWQAGLFAAPLPYQADEGMNDPNDASTDFPRPSNGHSLTPAIGTNQCVCMGCGEGFNSVYGFDKHQRMGKDGRPVCIHPLDLPKPMVKNRRGWWVTELREIDP